MQNFEIILQQQNRRDIKGDSVLYNNEIYRYFDAGLTRYVFVNADKTKVVKLLIEDNGKDFNNDEFEIYDNATDEERKQMAETKLVLNGMMIEQEFCNPIKFDDRELDMKQIQFASSCRNEVGWNSKGKLVCFDLDEYKKY